MLPVFILILAKQWWKERRDSDFTFANIGSQETDLGFVNNRKKASHGQFGQNFLWFTVVHVITGKTCNEITLYLLVTQYSVIMLSLCISFSSCLKFLLQITPSILNSVFLLSLLKYIAFESPLEINFLFI